MLDLLRDRRPRRATSCRASAAFPSRGCRCPAVATADDRLGAGARRRVRRSAARAWATAAAYYDRLLPLLAPATPRDRRRVRAPGRRPRADRGRTTSPVDRDRHRDPHRSPAASAARAAERRLSRLAAEALRDARRVALAVTLAIQIFTSLAAPATAVLAPVIAPDLGIPPQLIGVFVGLIYAGAMAGKPRLRRIHRALRRDPRVAGLRAAVRDRSRAGRRPRPAPTPAAALLRRGRSRAWAWATDRSRRRRRRCSRAPRRRRGWR